MTDAAPDRYRVPHYQPVGYGENIGLRETDPDKLIEALKRGLPISAFESLREALGVPKTELAAVLGISERTLARRFSAGRFNLDESERIYRIARLVARAAEVLESEAEGVIWLRSPKVHLKGATPLHYADTEVGAQTVERLLGRIEHGVFG